MKTYLLSALCLASALATPSLAQDWPSRPVKFVNATAPGGPSDTLARTVADILQKQFGQTFIVENKAGAAGNLAADTVAKSAGDGYTLLWGVDTIFTVNPHIYKTMSFKIDSLKPLVVVSTSGMLVGAAPATKFKSAREFLEAARKRQLNFSSGGNGSPGHLWLSMANEAAGTRLVHVPYRGNSFAVTAVAAAEVDGGTLAVPGMLPQVKSGKITPLAVTSATRSKLLPDVPTLTELGLPELQSEVHYVVMVPASTPEPLMQKMSKAVVDAVKGPDLQARLLTLDMAFLGLTGSAAEERLKILSNKYGRVIRATGMQVD